MKKFWMVLGGSGGCPTVKHLAEGVARAEAARLARKHPGQSFTVLVSEATVTVDNLKWENHEDEDNDGEIPF
jgi:hypothetical protein